MPATAAMQVSPKDAAPSIVLRATGDTWQPRRDLLGSDRFAPEFVVEMEEDGRAHLRFGDGTLGRAPQAGTTFAVTCRIGNGPAGNVGADALNRLVPEIPGVTVRNPLAASGGAAPEPLAQVKLYAPQAFRVQERAVTEADYVAVAERHPDVQRAAATRRFTGSWHTMFVTVDRRGGKLLDADFEAELRRFLESYRMAGGDLEIDAPRPAPLEIVLSVCVEPGHERAQVKAALLEAFSRRTLLDGTRGFFHPDNLTFGQPVYLSQVVARAMQVTGVQSVDVDDTPPRPDRFRRYGQPGRGEIAAGLIAIHRLEIARVDNDPSAPENGRIDFAMAGGL
jgi:predicted phage baseplate assembly protein